MTKMNRVYLLGTEKLYWRFYQNRMKNGRANEKTSRTTDDDDIMITIPLLLRGKNQINWTSVYPEIRFIRHKIPVPSETGVHCTQPNRPELVSSETYYWFFFEKLFLKIFFGVVTSSWCHRGRDTLERSKNAFSSPPFSVQSKGGNGLPLVHSSW